MMHLFLNGLAASAGGGLTYLRNVLPHLSVREGVQTTVTVTPQLRRELSGLPRISFPQINFSSGTVSRFWQEQTSLPKVIRRSGADVLLSVGNFALRKSPVPQILLSRNSLYTSKDFMRDLRQRREYGLWLDTRIKGSLARRSVHWADCTVAPTEAFAQELQLWTGREVVAIHHGFDHEAFFRDQTALATDIRQKLNPETEKDTLRLLYVSHYNYYRNFETLFRALPLMRQRLAGRKLKLVLTCRLRSEDNPGSYSAEAASALVTRLGIADSVVELGAVPYSLLHQVYRACDIYVSPAYAESFAHPLVEAMACGLPIVASDLAVHREICEDAALYFPRFSPGDLAVRVCQVATSDGSAKQLSDRGQERARDFSWEKHVDELMDLASNLLATIDPARRQAAGPRDISG
jgi:glycosyltransferase involved in cell wall biosynthesis